MALFGTDGVRGVANVDLTAELAVDLAIAAAHVLGFGSAFTLAPSAASIAAMDLTNPVAIVLISSILGVVAGNLAEKLAAAIK